MRVTGIWLHVIPALTLGIFAASFIIAVGYEVWWLLVVTWLAALINFRLLEPDNPGPFYLLLGVGGAVALVMLLTLLPGSTFERWRSESGAAACSSDTGNPAGEDGRDVMRIDQDNLLARAEEPVT